MRSHEVIGGHTRSHEVCTLHLGMVPPQEPAWGGRLHTLRLAVVVPLPAAVVLAAVVVVVVAAVVLAVVSSLEVVVEVVAA